MRRMRAKAHPPFQGEGEMSMTSSSLIKLGTASSKTESGGLGPAENCFLPLGFHEG